MTLYNEEECMEYFIEVVALVIRHIEVPHVCICFEVRNQIIDLIESYDPMCTCHV